MVHHCGCMVAIEKCAAHFVEIIGCVWFEASCVTNSTVHHIQADEANGNSKSSQIIIQTENVENANSKLHSCMLN